jgi:uncharacterized protein YkwD
MIKVVVKAPDGTRELAFTDPTVLIGRSGDCGIKLTDLKSSRKHAKLEKVGNEWRVSDLDTPNGTKLNGRDVNDVPLNAGDEVRVGETSIMIVELDTPPVARPKTEVIEKNAVPIEKKLEVKNKIDDVKRAIGEVREREAAPIRSKILAKIAGAAAAVILLVGGYIVVKAVLDQPKNDKSVAQRPAPKDETAQAHADQLLADLRQRAASGDVTDKLLNEIGEASTRFGSLLQTDAKQMNPFDQLLGALLQRRAEQFAARFGETRTKVDDALAARRYGEALAALAAFKATVDASYEEPVRELLTQVDARINEDFLAVMAMGRRMEDSKRYTEAASHYQANGARFKDTPHWVRISNKPQALKDLAIALAAPKPDPTIAKKPDPVAPSPDKPQPDKPQPDKPAPAPEAKPVGLVAKLIDAVKTGKFANPVKFDDKRSGKPVEATAETVTFQTSAGDANFAWKELPPAVLFKMGSDVLKGDDLLGVAEFGYQNSLKDDADKLCLRIYNADRKANKDKVDAVIAKGRGLSSVPEGGYTHDAKHGWEDAPQHDNRLAVETAAKHMKDLIATTDAKKRDGLFAKVMEIYDKPTLTAETRETVKQNTLASLKEWKKKNMEAIQKTAKSGALGGLAGLKAQLNQARKDALAVIYDVKIYLPEDHPDWRKGDKINGQEKVDQLVDVVRKIWERPGEILMPGSVKKDVEEIKEVNEKYLTALGETVDTEEELKAFEEVVNNLNQKISIQSYCANGSEKSIYDWNRRCERYNEACTESGVGSEEKAHADVLNDYREMMGRKRLFLDGRICKATKKHSQACDAAGTIWHVGSDGSPQSRAQAEGFTGGVGENVAIGYGHPSDVWWQGWYRASDHHRNGLSDAWNCMGYGYVGRVGTQNFSNIGSPKGF